MRRNSVMAREETLPECAFEPSPLDVVREMLDIAGVGPGDVLYDLGCGDGRIAIAAARRGARAVGVDHDPRLIDACRQNAVIAGVPQETRFIASDLFTIDVRDATVVTLFLTRPHNLDLRPRLLEQLGPGTRIVSHYHDMRDWEPDEVGFARGRPVYLWQIRGARGPGEALWHGQHGQGCLFGPAL